jgi:hypothetical protein
MAEGRSVPTTDTWTSTEITDLLRAAHADMNEPLSMATARAWADAAGRRFPSERTFVVYFGGWSSACESAGVPHARTLGETPPGPPPTTSDECWQALQAFVEESEGLGMPPTMERYQLRSRERGWPSRNTVRLRLGLGWQEAIDEARRRGASALVNRHVPVNHTRRDQPVPTVDEMLTAMTVAAADYEGRLSVAQYRDWARRQPAAQPPPDAIRARFGSWSAACRAAGIHAGRGSWPAIDVVTQLQRAYMTVGDPFTMARFRAWARHQPSPICHLTPETASRALGSWTACQAAATAVRKR